MNQEKTALQKVYDQLKKDGKIESQIDLAEKTGFAAVPMSQMLRGIKPIPLRLLESLHDQFDVNANFLLSSGKGDIYRADESDLSVKLLQLEKENEILKRQLDDKEKIISLMESLRQQK